MGRAAAGRRAPRRIHVSRVARLEDAQVLYGSGHDIEASGRAPGFRGLLGAVWRERGFGDFWGYALLAEGAAEAMVEVDLSTWDIAAPLVLVEEAGGRVTDFDGAGSIDGGTFLASNGLLHDEVLGRLARPDGRGSLDWSALACDASPSGFAGEPVGTRGGRPASLRADP